MSHLIPKLNRVTWRVLLVILFISGFLLYASTIDRTAYTTEQLIIIPGSVSTDSFENLDSVLIQDLSGDALYQNFSLENSAYIDSSSRVNSSTTDEVDDVDYSDNGTTSEVIDESEVSDGNTSSSDNTDSQLDTETDTGTESQSENAAETEDIDSSTGTENNSSGQDSGATESSSDGDSNDSNADDAAGESMSMLLPVLEMGHLNTTTERYPWAQLTTVEPIEETTVEEVVEENNSSEDSSNETLPDESASNDNSLIEETTDSENQEVSNDEATESQVIEDQPASEVVDTSVTEATSTTEGEESTSYDIGDIFGNVPCSQISGCVAHTITFDGFTLPEFEPNTVLDSVQLRLSLAAKAKEGSEVQRFVISYSYNDIDWLPASVIDVDGEISNSINGDYQLVSIDAPQNPNQISTLKVRVTYEGIKSDLEKAYVDSVWLEVTSGQFYEEGDYASTTDAITYERDLEEPTINEMLSPDVDVLLGEDPEFTFEYERQQNFFRRAIVDLFGENTFSVKRIDVEHVQYGRIETPFTIEYHDDTVWTLKLPNDPYKLHPGKYRVNIVVNENDEEYSDYFEFYWGVLAVNTKKSMYRPSEEAVLNMAALTEEGDTICDAHLFLKIISPSNNIYEVPVNQSGSCGLNNVTDIPDYLASFTNTEEIGNYSIQLEHRNIAGDVVHKITDSFVVQEYIPYDIERTAPTRIYPPSPYKVDLKITANRSFSGDIVERVPRGFIVDELSEDALVVTLPDYTEIKWPNVSMEEGEVLQLSYRFDAPDISPYLYLLGPLDMGGFKELRSWQIASDALSGIGWFTGTRTVAGTNLNAAASPIQWATTSIDTYYYEHSTSSNSQRVTLRQDGDYFVAVTLPQDFISGANQSRVGIEVRVNGVAVPQGLGRSGFIANANNHSESSSHANFMLNGITGGDYVEVYAEGLTTIGTQVINVTNNASLYLEYMPSTETVFSATTTRTVASSSLNVSTSSLQWTETRQDSGFVHSDTVNPENITISNAGVYMVQVSVPLTGTAANQSVQGRVLLDGVTVPGGIFSQGYIQNTLSDTDSSIHWSGIVVATTSNQVLSIATAQEAAAGTVTVTSGFVGSIFVQKLPSTDVFVARGRDLVSGADWNTVASTSVRFDVQMATSSTFTHSTSTNNERITVNSPGDYMLTFNGAFTSTGNRNNNRIVVYVNGQPVRGAQVKSNFELGAGGHQEGSSALTYLLTGLATSSIITITTQREANTTAINDTTDALVMLWKKVDFNARPDAPTIASTSPFDNIRFASTTPTFEFQTSDSDGTSDLQYEFSFATSSDFSNAITKTSGVDAGFVNVASSSDTSPFTEGTAVRYTIQPSDAFSDLTTYYWRVRARDVTGSNTYGDWSTTRSLSVNLAASTPNWYQTYSGQFDGNTLVGTVSSGNDKVQVDAAVSTEMLIAYGEGSVSTPRYRLWNGTSWGIENNAVAVGGTINWLDTAAGVSRDEYAMITLDATSASYAQIYSASSSSWGNQVLIASGITGPQYRGVAVAYESLSGDAVAVSCGSGPDPLYRVWNGSSWTGTSTLDVSSLNNCNFVMLASDPASDEIIALVRDTGTTYEAVVWDGTSWGNGRTFGTAPTAAAEGMALAYEASGEQAVVTVANGTAASFLYMTWNGTEWSSSPSTQTIGNDFYRATLTASDDDDELMLCYIDADTDVGVMRWDGGVWSTFVAATNEVETTANSVNGRPIDCEFESMSGRDEYELSVYSDTTNVRYRTSTSSTWATEASVATIEDSFWVQTERAGDGTVVAVALDDTVDDIISSRWNGSGWSANDVLETSPSSVLASPYEVYDLVAKRFQFTQGSVVTDPISFTSVAGQRTWGDIDFSTTEPFGTEVLVQVLYTASTTCDTLVPNGALSGNSTGFTVDDVPIDISGVSTTTYNQLCLKATITTLGSASASLDDWTLSWVREPKLIQSAYRWYSNLSSLTPTDAWPAGADDVVESNPILSTAGVNINDVLRLRIGLTGANVPLPTSTDAFKLQYAEGQVCAPTLSWSDVGVTGSTTAIWRGYANTIVGSDWYSSSTPRRIRVTVENTLVGTSSAITNFPVYLNLDDFPATFFDNVQSDGDDIRITTSDGVTEIPYELVSINTTTDTGELHFKAPTLSSTTDTTFYVYYGNGSASGYAANATYGSRNVWTNDYVAVYHLKETGSTAVDVYKDSTRNQYHAQGGAGVAANVPTATSSGYIGIGQSFDGAGDLITNNLTAGAMSLASATPKTISAWTYARAFNNGGVFRLGSINTNGQDFSFRTLGVANQWRTQHWGTPDHDFTLTPSQDTWRLFSVAFDGTTSRAYGDAVLRNSEVVSLNTANGTTFGIGTWNGTSLNGIIDEVRIASTSRSLAWHQTEFNNQSNPTGFYSVASEEIITDDRTLPSALLSATDRLETYEENNPTETNNNTLGVGEQAEWDFVLQNNGATADTTYCFRLVYTDGSTFKTYNTYPRLITNAPPQIPTLSRPFDNEQLASSTPWFEFVASDDLEDDVSYEIEVDDDYDFSSPLIDRESNANFSEFTNLVTPSERGLYTSGQTIRFIPTTSLSNGVTYYWRVRARDDNGSGSLGEWSAISSVTLETTTTITTWYQTTGEQFASNNLLDTTANLTSDDIRIDTGLTIGTTTSSVIDYDDRTTGNAWGSLSFNQNVTSGSIRYYVEYLVSGENFSLIPDSALTGNSAGFTSSPVSLANVDPDIYNELRIVAVSSGNDSLPRLQDWTVTWGLTIEEPTIVQPFDNAKVSTTSPTFTFYTSDPQGQDLQYEFQWSTSYAFTSSSTFTSGVDSGFTNTQSGGDLSPFNSGQIIRYTPSTTFTNGQTYWWRARAKDPSGADAWSNYSEPASFTVDTSITTSVWHQTTGEQFATNDLTDIETTSGAAQITTTLREMMIAYGEGTGQSPRYRIFDGSEWLTAETAQSVGAQIRWTRLAAAPTRPEYGLATIGTDNDVNIQIYNAASETWGNVKEIEINVANNQRSATDISYETSSGDLVAVSCSGTDAVYAVWNGTTWSATSSINLANANNCEWVQMASDPTSDEIIAIFRHSNVGTTDFEAQVWNGSSWGNSTTFADMQTDTNEGMAVEYEESGNQAVFVASNNAATSVMWSAWNGSSWTTATATTAGIIGDHIEWASMRRDVGTDKMSLCYIDNDGNIGVMPWTGSAWATTTEIEATGNSNLGHPIDCAYETTSGRDGYIVAPYSDNGAAGAGDGGKYQTFATSSWSGEIDNGTIEDSWRVIAERSGDGTVHAVYFDDGNDRYELTRWDGSGWTTRETITNPSITGTPFDGSLAMAAQVYPNFTEGAILSNPINFSDGTGPRWERFSWNDSTPGASDIRYRLYYATSSNYVLVPDSVLSGNSAGFTTSPVSISSLDRTIYSNLKLEASFACSAGTCPTLQDWTLEWSEGITVSGRAYEYNGTSTTTSGTVAVAVNGTFLPGKTGTIQPDGTWTITNVTAFEGQTVMVFVDGASTTDEAIALATYDGTGDMQNLELTKRHVTIGSSDTATTTNSSLFGYDNTDDEDIFVDIGTNGSFNACIESCPDTRVKVKSGAIYQPNSNITTHDFVNNGTFRPATSTVRVQGSWENNGTLVEDTSTVIMTATSTSETIGGTATSTFYNLTLGETSGTATFTISRLLDVNGSFGIDFGTLARGTSSITIARDLRIGSAGSMTGMGTTTFDGTGSFTWQDSTASTTNIGNVVIDGSAKTITLASNVMAESITIGADDTLNASGSGFNINVWRNWTNNNSFIPQSGTVTFLATTSATIARGTSAFNNVTFNGVGGIWSFSTSTLVLNGSLTIATGTVTLPTGTTSIGASFLNTGGSFAHNNGEVRFTSSASGRSITSRATQFQNAFYDMVFTGAGGWTFTDAATTSRNMRITAGTVTMASTTVTVGGDFITSGSGAFQHNNGELIFLIIDADTLQTNGSSINNMRVLTGSGSTWYNNSWEYRTAVTVQSGQVGTSSAIIDFPVYVNLNHLGSTFFSNVKSDGSDVRVTLSDGITEVPSQVVQISTASSTGELHFKAPSLSTTTNTTFYIYYGNQNATANSRNATYGSENVWTNNYVAVYHLNEVGTTSTSSYTDSTRNQYHAQGGGVAADIPALIAGQLGNAQSFVSNDFISVNRTASQLGISGSVAKNISAWAYTTTWTGGGIWGIGSSVNDQDFSLRTNGGTGLWRTQHWGNDNDFTFNSNAMWAHFSVDFDGTNSRTYANGTLVASRLPQAINLTNTNALTIGRWTTNYFGGRVDELRVSSTSRSVAWLRTEFNNQASTTNFYATSTAEPRFARTFTDTNATVLGSIVIESGLLGMPAGVLSVGGSFDNNGGFTATSGTVRFNSSSSAETIAAGSSTFATLEFSSNSGGDFIITENATATVAINLVNANQFTVASGTSLATQGTFSNAMNGSNTTWTGSTLRLLGTDGAMNLKSHAGDSYNVIALDGDTDMSMWNSSAASIVTASTSSLYSQDHSATDGLLHIYGDYNRTTGTENWKYDTDFDGTALGTSSVRAVSVRVASSSTVTVTNAGLDMRGVSGATTSVAAISGKYNFVVASSTLNAEYFSVTDTALSGMQLTGNTYVPTFSYGRFTVSTASGTAMTIASTTINNNPATQYFYIDFASTSASTTNVTTSGTTASFWWFRQGGGNLYGEANDADGGNPGMIQWDDSSFSITVSGVVYQDDGVTPMIGGVCDGISPVVTVVVDTTVATTTNCDPLTGTYTARGISFTGDPTITAYINRSSYVSDPSQVALRAQVTGTSAPATAGYFTINRPTVQTGDLLVAIIGKDDYFTITPPPGWYTATQLGVNSNDVIYSGMWYRPVTNAADEPASYHFTSNDTSAEDLSYFMASFSGVDLGNPFEQTPTTTKLVNPGTSASAPNATTTVNGSYVLAMWYVDTDNDITMPGGSWSTLAEDIVSADTNNLSVAGRLMSVAGAPGVATITGLTAGDDPHVAQYALRRATRATTTDVRVSATVARTPVLNSAQYNPAPITLVDSLRETGTAAITGTIAVRRPMVQNGDVLVAIVNKDDDLSITPPSGWTAINTLGTTGVGTDMFTGAWYKVATSGNSEPTTYSFVSTDGTTEGYSYWIGSFRGVDPLNPIDATAAWANNVNSATPSAASVTTVTANTYVLAAWWVSGDNDVTLPGGSWTTLAEDIFTEDGLSVASRRYSTAGATGAAALSGVTATAETHAIQIPLRPAGYGVPDRISNFDLYSNRVIVRSENSNPIRIAEMADFDSSDDSDVPFTYQSSPDRLTVGLSSGLWVWASSTFTPGGNITLGGNASSTSAVEGTLTLATSSQFVAAGTETHTLAGRLVLGTSALLTPASSTFIMNATTTGKSITSVGTVNLHNLTFNGLGGAWNIGANLSLTGDMAVSTGTVTGTGNITLTNGSVSGNGTLSLGAGTLSIHKTNSFGGTTPWTVYNMILGDGGTVGTTTPPSSATTTVLGALTINIAHFLNAGSSRFDLAGTGTVFTNNGTFITGTSRFTYSGNTATVLGTTYYDLTVAAAAGSSVFTAAGSGLNVSNNLVVGNGTASSTLSLLNNDPVLSVTGNVLIMSSSTFAASDIATSTFSSSYDNNGTFAANGGKVLFNGSGSNTISAGNSSFANVTINGSGNFTINENATSTGTFTLQNHANFTVASSTTLAVGGQLNNILGGVQTTWSGTLHLFGGGSQSINASTTSDVYNVLSVASGTKVRMWNSSASTYNISGGLYSQDHAGADGSLYIYGTFNETSANDYWSYSTDFDGTILNSSTSRAVTVRINNGSTAVWSGGSLTVIGTSTASTSIQNQGSGSYSLAVGGSATTEWRYVTLRDLDANGLIFSGSPTVTDFSYTDHLVQVNSGTGLTIGGTVINANEAKNFTQNKFVANGGVTGAVNVTATGTSISSWRFTNHSGALSGEASDNDPAGDPGYIVWDDSAAVISVTGNVYSDEGSTVSTVCDGSTNNIVLRVAGLTSYTTSCNASTGVYTFTGVAYSPLDSLIVYIDGETEKAANVTKAPISSISSMHLYENRVIVRHENTNPITIADMAVWDSSDDADIPFTAVDAGTDTLTLGADKKLIIWTGKTFAPAGNVTLSGGGSGAAFDGTLEALTNARFRATSTETHSINGSFIFGTGATFDPAQSTTTFNTSGAARTIDTNNGGFYNVNFTGSGSWTITDTNFVTGRSYAQSAGTVTFGSGTTTIGASFNVTGGTFSMSGSALVFNSSSTGNIIRFNNISVPTLRFTGTGGAWSMSDTNATTTGSFELASNGTVTLPSGNLAVGGSFNNASGTITHNTADIIMTGSGSLTLRANGSDLYALRKTGTGTVTIDDGSITFRDDLVLATGTLVAATNTLAVGGSFDTASGTYNANGGTVLFNATAVGKTIALGNNSLYNVTFGSGSGGWTWTGNATTTNNLTLSAASSFNKATGTTLVVGGVFTNSVGGTATIWNDSVLSLTNSAAYTINTKTTGGDVYGTLSITAADIRAWNSSAATTTTGSGASFYSQDHAATDGSLYIYGDFSIATTTEYWSHATDFDGTALGGSSRTVTVRMAQNATTTLLSGTLNILGSTSASTTIRNQATGTYAMIVRGGTINANRYVFNHLNADGLQLENTPTITDLSYGYYDLAVNGGSLITLSSTTLNANASKIFSYVGFNASGSLSGVNVELTGTTPSAWRFDDTYGSIRGEAYDIDGGDACGSVRFDDSSCLLTSQTQYRWRSDDGGEGAPNSEWYDLNWDYRQRIRVTNADAVAYSTTSIKVTIPYDASMKTDFSDLRFTLSDGVTPISYWRERYVASTEAIFWIKVPSLPANTINSYFVYYGNSAASTTTSSGTSTFSVFDDFEDGGFTEYSGDTSLFTVDTAPVYGGSYALEALSKTGRTTDGIYRNDVSVAQGQIIRYMQYIDTAAGSGDEACTMFGVQSPGTLGTNYAVCLEQYGVDRISLVKDVDDNDGSGTMLSSSTVSYSTGWYEVEIDWQTDNDIFVYLYNSSGSVVASTSANNSAYTSGGIGFTFWFQNGSWDSYTARPRGPINPTVYLGAKQTNGGASWLAAQNTAGSGLPGDTRRLRIAVENSGLDVTGQTYRLQYAAKGASPSCEAVSSGSFAAVPNQASCGSSPVCMQSSSQVTDGDATTDHLLNTEGAFVSGNVVENPSNITSGLDINQSYYTELEYVITPTVNASDSYCFRVVNNATPIDYYSRVPELGLQFDPSFGPITLNGGADITLTPNATTTVYATGTVTDFNGYADIVAGTSTIYRSGAGAACSADTNNCYISTTSAQCQFTNCSGNTCVLSCRADIYFHADPTDASTYEGEEWLAYMEVEDAGGGYDFASASGVELLTLRALNVDNGINYGSLAPADNTGNYNPTTTVSNIGNTPFDIEIDGTDLTDGGSSIIPSTEQKFSTSTFSYSACVTCSVVSSTTPTELSVNLAKPTSPTPPITTNVYWGIEVPLGVNSAPHQGINVFTPVSP